jgi:carboxymethylenebutenolidase
MARSPSPYVTLSVGDGTTMQAFVARPPGRARRPGLLLCQEAFGVNDHIKDVARRCARAGWTTIAPELFHRTAPPGFAGSYGDFEGVRAHVQALSPEHVERDIGAAHAWLQADARSDAARVAALGFCMGGRVAYLANATVPLRAAVSFYGGGIVPALLDRAARLSGPQLFFWGGADTHIPPEQRRAVIDTLRQAGKAYTNVEFSEAGHGFFCDQRPSYHAVSARRAWLLTRDFLTAALA